MANESVQLVLVLLHMCSMASGSTTYCVTSGEGMYITSSMATSGTPYSAM